MTTIRVVLVDDAASFLDSARAFLSRLRDVEVVGTASTGLEGIALARQHAPDLVLMDLMMPGMSGLAATTLLKALSTPPRVVIVSLHDHPAYWLASKEALADGFVCKSDFTEEVPAIIESLFPRPRCSCGNQGGVS